MKIFKGKKFIVISIILFLVFSVLIYAYLDIRVSKSNGITIVIDAGHGGLDVK